MEKIAGWAILVVLVAALGTAVGVTIYNQHQANLAALPNYTVSEKVVADMAGILEETTEAAAETEAETEAE